MLASEAVVTLAGIEAGDDGHTVIHATYSLSTTWGRRRVLLNSMENARGVDELPLAHMLSVDRTIREYPIAIELGDSPQARQFLERFTTGQAIGLADLLGLGANIRLPEPPAEFQGQNIELTKGVCAACRINLDPSWIERPSLGDTCRSCFRSSAEVFRPEHVEIHVRTSVNFDPLTSVHEYEFNWAGTRIQVDDMVGTVLDTTTINLRIDHIFKTRCTSL